MFAGDPGSFARTAGLPPTATSDTSLVAPTPGSSSGGAGGGGGPAVGGGPGIITLPPPCGICGNGGGDLPVVPGVPEPQTWLLFALGLGALAFVARRRTA